MLNLMVVLFQIFCFMYVMMGLAYLINNFLMPCLEIISRKCDFNDHTAGILLALGCSVFEMTTNIFACFNEDKEMAQFGLGIIVGSGVFDFTLCFGIASVFSSFYHKESKYFNIQVLMRDIYFYLLSLIYVVIICWDFKVTLAESMILVLFYPIYVIFSFYASTDDKSFSTSIENDNNNISNIKKSLPWTKIYKNLRKNPFNIYNNNYKFDYDEKHALNNKDSENTDEEEESLLLINENDKNNCVKNLFIETNWFVINIFKAPWKFVYSKTLWYEKLPFLAFLCILIYCSLLSRYLIYSVELLLSYFPVSHTFIGLTFASWGGNISDIANATISAKNCKIELATSTVIGSQIVNLQLCLGVPWLLSNIISGNPIYFSDTSLFNSILAIFIIVLLTLFLITASKYKLSGWLGLELIVLYALYIGFEFYQNFSK